LKKFASTILIFAIILSSSLSFASISDKLVDHWSNSQINRSFVAYYFPYLSKDYFAKFDPDGEITEQEFILSTASLFRDLGYDILLEGTSAGMSREDMVRILGTRLEDVGLTIENDTILPFKDVNTMPNDSIELLKLLYSNNIIVGDSAMDFSPNRKLSQAESIIILQRVKEVLESMNTIAFRTLGIVQSYNNQEEIIIKEENDKILVTITKEFPTPGYSMTVDKILRERGSYRVYFDIAPPPSDSMQLQVVTYKTLTLEIEKAQLSGGPYNFKLDGFNSIITS
jgi:hypothetical protein